MGGSRKSQKNVTETSSWESHESPVGAALKSQWNHHVEVPLESHGSRLAPPLGSRGNFMGFSRDFHGRPMRVPWGYNASMGLPWDFGGASMVLSWGFHCPSMGLSWDSHRIPLDCLGNLMGLPWCFHKLPWNYSVPMGFHGTSVGMHHPGGLPWISHRAPMVFSWCFHGPRLSWHVHGVIALS